MAHVVYVDLSAKVEHWQTDSAVAVADGFSVTYLVRVDRPEVSSGFVQMANVKGTRADRLARQVFAREVLPTRVVTWSEVESIIRRK